MKDAVTNPEEWRAIPGYEGCYEASSAGQIRSVDRFVHRSIAPFKLKGRILRPRADATGRPSVMLRKHPNPPRTVKVCLLVLEAFVGPRPEGMWCCHYDDNPSNNNIENLRWDTPSANAQDRVRNGGDVNASKTHCIHGHEFTPENTVQKVYGGRQCRTCLYVHTNAWKRRARAAARAARTAA